MVARAPRTDDVWVAETLDRMGLKDGGQGLVSVAPLVLLPTDNHEACAPISVVAVPLGRGCTPARQPAGEGEHGVSRVLRGREHTAAHDDCIHLITTLSACRRRCKSSLPIGVDAESLTWDMGRGPPVAPELWVAGRLLQL